MIVWHRAYGSRDDGRPSPHPTHPNRAAGGLLSVTPTTKETNLADESLVAGLRERDPRALERLLELHGAEIQAVAYLILRNVHDAEETLADTLLTAWRKASTIRDTSRLRPWLLTTATRLALRRRRGFRPQIVSLDVAREQSDRDSSPVDRLALQEAINALPPRMRAVVALHDVADLPLAEVAAALGRSENTVKSQLREARARLRRAFAEDSDPVDESPA
jgi:RNA polymerase sigma-70 factor, ECF subfamily